MPIFDDHKLIFVHIPKTAGQSVIESFGMPLDVSTPELHLNLTTTHHTAIEVRNVIGDGKFSEFLKFAVIRNPLDRFASEFLWRKKHKNFRDGLYTDGISLKDFASNVQIAKKTGLFKVFSLGSRRHFYPQCKYIYDNDGGCLVDRVFRFEDMVCLASFVESYTGKFLHQNKSGGKKSYQEMYDEETEQKVREMYADDFKIFGY